MNNDGQNQNIPFPEELEYLEAVSQKLEKALHSAEEEVRRIDGEYRDAKRYMAEYRGEIDPHEMFQNELLLKQTDQTGAFAAGNLRRLERMKESPYFARIDFRENDCCEAERFYIGRFTFSCNNEFLVYDWRAPVAGMFYDCQPGQAGYEAPAGRIDGELTRKRQYKIKDGVLEYAVETTDNIQDDVLQRELAHTSDEKMKTIISTIQKEQNQIIRNERADTLIIQGVAGSGKTSVALHRIAFLLYRFQNRIKSQNVAILSPNKVFGDFISGVIPELGEEPVCELGFSDIAQIQLEGIMEFEPEKDPLEISDSGWNQRARFKSTAEFLKELDGYIEGLGDRIFQPEDYIYGKFRVSGGWIRRRVNAYGSLGGKNMGRFPLKKRLAMAAQDICRRFQEENVMGDEVPNGKEVLKRLTSGLLLKSSLALYRDFYTRTGRKEMFVMPSSKTLEWEDVWPYLYVQAAFEGIRESPVTRHLVIDEMQDYTPVQYAVLNLLFPCRKTILGDFGQNANPNHLCNLTDLRGLYEDAEFIRLDTSYRSTYEIMEFAGRLGHVPSLKPVRRHGEKTELIPCRNEEEELRWLKQAVRDFNEGKNATLGIIMKTESAARELHGILCREFKVNLITRNSSAFEEGVSVTSVRMSKGLEFDEVIVPHADTGTYVSDSDRSLLYIACTRAMHRLTVSWAGETIVNGT